LEDLIMEGDPVLLFGELGVPDTQRRVPGKQSVGQDGGGQPQQRAAPGTDLGALDSLGMAVALGYETRRLQRAGATSPRILAGSGDATDVDTLVVDVHSPEAINTAESLSPVVKQVMLGLESRGISRLYPGFDILSILNGEADRLVELKSSGVDARVQTMSWNEWKTAKSSDIRSRYWLYLVGNLRADLPHARPFVRAINDPFGTLAGEELREHHVSRAVQLRVREFKVAEHLELGLRDSAAQDERAPTR
jgi:hypothetical protein